MPRVSPFAGLLFDTNVAGPLHSLIAPPYDAVTPEQERRLHDANPFNVIRLILGREEPGDGAEHNKYTRAAERLRHWREAGALRSTDEAWFPYEMRFTFNGETRRVRGLICQVELEELGGSIVPHEETLPGPTEDRLALLRAVRANLSPIYGLTRGPCAPLAELLEDELNRPPIADITDDEGVEHRMWVVRDAPQIEEWLAQDEILIADGHHRYSVALTYRTEMRNTEGPGPWDRILMLLVDAAVEDPPVLPIHRLVSEPPAGQETTPVRDLAEVLAGLDDDRLTYGTATRMNGDVVHHIGRLSGLPPTVYEVHAQLVASTPVLRFMPDAAEADAAVHRNEAPAAIFLPPTRVDRIRGVLERGHKLPQKSTYFWPKPRTGMVIRPFI